MAKANPYKWSPATGQYVGPGGRFVARSTVRAAIDLALDAEKARALLLSQKLRNGTISLDAWRAEMREMIKTVHLYDAAIARGGFAQMTAADYGRVGQIVRLEYGWLERFAVDLASGRQPLDGRFLRRAQDYAEAGRATYHATETATMRNAGFRYEWNILHPADHCIGCLGETSRGRVPIGALIPIGSRDCRRKCKCTKGFSREP